MRKVCTLFLFVSVVISLLATPAFAIDTTVLEKANAISESVQPDGAGEWEDIGQGYKVRLDRPSPADEAKWHVHVYEGKKEVTAENCDGTASHGQTLDSLPKKIKEKVKNGKLYQEGKKKQAKLQQAASDVKAKKLDLYNTFDLVIAIAIFVVALGFWLFSKQSYGSWRDFITATT